MGFKVILRKVLFMVVVVVKVGVSVLVVSVLVRVRVWFVVRVGGWGSRKG